MAEPRLGGGSRGRRRGAELGAPVLNRTRLAAARRREPFERVGRRLRERREEGSAQSRGEEGGGRQPLSARRWLPPPPRLLGGGAQPHGARGVVDGAIETRSFGTGLSVVRFSGIYDTILLANITPVEREISHAMYAFIQPKATENTLGKSVGKAIIANICQQMDEDQIIWQRKQYFERPLLCDGDGPFAKFRRWYDQFLVETQ